MGLGMWDAEECEEKTLNNGSWERKRKRESVCMCVCYVYCPTPKPRRVPWRATCLILKWILFLRNGSLPKKTYL